MNVVLRHVLGLVCISVSIVFLMAGLGLGFMLGITHKAQPQPGDVVYYDRIITAFIVIGAFIVIPAWGAFTLMTGKEDVSKKRKKA